MSLKEALCTLFVERSKWTNIDLHGLCPQTAFLFFLASLSLSLSLSFSYSSWSCVCVLYSTVQYLFWSRHVERSRVTCHVSQEKLETLKTKKKVACACACACARDGMGWMLFICHISQVLLYVTVCMISSATFCSQAISLAVTLHMFQCQHCRLLANHDQSSIAAVARL